MKTYTSQATKWLAMITFIFIVILVTGIVFIVANPSGIGVGLTICGGFLSPLFLTCFLSERSRYLTIHEHEIDLPKGVEKSGKNAFQRTVLRMDEISSVESKLYKGDGLITKDAYFHTLKLKNGTKITLTLYAYGKQAEKEILQTVKKHIG